MKISLALNPGDFLDRLSIARIRHAKLNTRQTLETIQQLDATFIKVFSYDEIEMVKRLQECLHAVNENIWDANNGVETICGHTLMPDALSRFRDQRNYLKAELDKMFGEKPEEKSYT